MMDKTEEILNDAREAKLLIDNRIFKKVANYVNNGLDDAILNCKFEKPGDSDKLILSKQLFNRMMTAITTFIEEGKSVENTLAKQLLKDRKEVERKNPIFNRDAS